MTTDQQCEATVKAIRDAAITALEAVGSNESVILYGPGKIVFRDGHYRMAYILVDEFAFWDREKYIRIELEILRWALEQVREQVREYVK